MKKVHLILAFLMLTAFTAMAQPTVTITSKVFLAGCYDPSAGLMKDSLRYKSLLPLVSPYDNTTTTTSSLFLANGSQSVVDWVLIKLKSASNTISKSCLVLRNGTIVDENGSNTITIIAPSDSYIVQVTHRNHLGCQTLNKIYLSGTASNIDFTTIATPLYLRPSPNNNPSPSTGATRLYGTVRALFGGNCNQVGAYANFIVYSNLANSDRTALFNYTGMSGVISGYTIYDCNMNGEACFSGLLPDRLTILDNCANSTGIYVNQQTNF